MNVKMRQRAERAIVRRVVMDAVAAGYALNVNNGCDAHELPAPSANPREVLAAMFATDDDWLIYYRDNKEVGWVRFIYGESGYDVIHDYTTNLESVMRGGNQLADKYAP